MPPRTVACHICGREFGSASIDIHVPQCAKKWETQEELKPAHQRRPVPSAPELEPGQNREAYNEQALKKWNDEALLACPNCGRTFLPDRLEIHLRSCRPKSAGGNTRSVNSPAAQVEAACAAKRGEGSLKGGYNAGRLARPQTVVCHICGRDFGSTSIDIHVPQCAKKWEAQEALKPKHERRPLPTTPVVEPGVSRHEYNEAATKRWNDEALLACPNCGRTFLPDRLEVHLRSCRGDVGAASLRQPHQTENGSASVAKVARSSSEGPRVRRDVRCNTAPLAKPKAVVCHICGREFGSASIDIHVPQCVKKWEAKEAQKPKHERRPVPTVPSVEPGVSREAYNEVALQKWNDEALLPCPNCGRTFLPDRLEIHMRGCKSSSGAAPSRSSLAPPASSIVRSTSEGPPQRPRFASAPMPRPRTVVCHICGREFGSASIDIHVPQCAKKWEANEARKPKNERRPLPSAPVADLGVSREVYNEAAMQKWNDEALLPCPNCGRTFLPDRLEIHLRGCKPKDGTALSRHTVSSSFEAASASAVVRSTSEGPRPARNAGSSAGGYNTTRIVKPQSVVCHICGREFGSTSIDIHIPQCAKKWEAQEALKPKHERRPVPTTPVSEPGVGRDAYNEAALQKWNDEALLACPSCGRTFLPDRLEIHLRSCRPKDGIAVQQASTAQKVQSSGLAPTAGTPLVKPRMVACHICGREFGSASIDIHVPQCAKIWEAREAQKPLEQRRPVPSTPVLEPGQSLASYNEAALQKWNDEALLACPNCARTFLPDRLEVHLRSCRPKAPSD